MKILQISASYKPAYVYGGPIMSVSMLSEQLAKAGVEVNVFTTTANGVTELPVETKKPVMVDGINVLYFNRITKDHTQFSPALLIHLWKKAKDFDAVHIHAWWNLVAVLSCLVATLKKVPVIVSPRGTLSSYSFSNKNNGIKGLIHNLLTKPLLKKCFIHATSNQEYQALKTIIEAKDFFNIPNFIRLDEKKNYAELKPEPYLKLIFLSRIEEKKGLDILLNALKDVTGPYRLTIAGDGNQEYVNSLKELAKKNNIDGHVDWLGFQSDNKFELLHQHDLFVLPSYDENFGNVIIESLSVGTAVLIGENVGLAEYVVNHKMGWLCRTEPASVTEAINAIGKKADELKQIKKDAPGEILKDFDANNLVKKYIDMYNQIIPMSEYQEYGYETADPCHTFYYLRGPLLSLLDKNTNKCILDMGCGNGFIANYLIEQGFNVYGTDASEDGIKIANEKNPGRFFIQDFSTGELPEALQGFTFDTIISTEVIEHLYDPYKFAEQCKQILSKTKGELIVSTPYHGYLKNLMLGVFNKWDRHISPLWQGGHIKFWSRNTVTQLMNQSGFKVTDFRGCGRFPYFWMSMIIKAKVA